MWNAQSVKRTKWNRTKWGLTVYLVENILTLAQSLFSPKKEEDAIFKIESLQYYYKQLYHKPPAFCMVGLNKLLTCNRYICSKTFVTFLGAEIYGDFSVLFHFHSSSDLFWMIKKFIAFVLWDIQIRNSTGRFGSKQTIVI